MSISSEKAKKLLQLYNKIKPFNQLLQDIKPDKQINDEYLYPGPNSWTSESVEKRLIFIY